MPVPIMSRSFNGAAWRRSRMIGLAVLCLAGATGCSYQSSSATVQAVPVSKSTSAAQPAPKPAASESAGEEREMRIKLYYGDDRLTSLHPLEKTIRYAEPAEKYRLALEGLQDNPEGKLVSLFQSFTFLSVKAEEGKVTVDLKIAPEGQFGAAGEDLVVRALMDTLFQFEEVAAIDILVDGQTAESLMGHVSLPHPILR